MFFSFFESPFWRGSLWIGGFLGLYLVLGFQLTVVIALATIAMRQRDNKALFF
tara:strand:+ start:5300 stop:5458 length:159 start_codon:yes stop_codon:yes gene_type:complete